MRTTLASGAWIDHVPVQDLKGGHKRKLDRTTKLALPPGAVSEDGQVDMDALMSSMDMTAFAAAKQDATWALLIDKWSYDLPVPDLTAGGVEGSESFDEIPIDDYEEIGQVLAPHAAKLARRPNPKHSTTSASNGSSPARAGASPKG
jgi:hypothetical protein